MIGNTKSIAEGTSLEVECTGITKRQRCAENTDTQSPIADLVWKTPTFAAFKKRLIRPMVR